MPNWPAAAGRRQVVVRACEASLPALEVEVLDGEEEEEGEEANDDEMEAGHQLKVAILQAEVPLQELAHRLLPESRHQDLLRPVSELREHQPVHRPCRRVGPVHPPPPHRHHLQQFYFTHQMGVWYVPLSR